MKIQSNKRSTNHNNEAVLYFIVNKRYNIIMERGYDGWSSKYKSGARKGNVKIKKSEIHLSFESAQSALKSISRRKNITVTDSEYNKYFLAPDNSDAQPYPVSGRMYWRIAINSWDLEIVSVKININSLIEQAPDFQLF